MYIAAKSNSFSRRSISWIDSIVRFYVNGNPKVYFTKIYFQNYTAFCTDVKYLTIAKLTNKMQTMTIKTGMK